LRSDSVSCAEVAYRDRPSMAQPAWQQREPWLQTLTRRLSADLADEGIAAQAEVQVGQAQDVVLEAAQRDGVDLVVLGHAKDDLVDRIQLGSTLDSLVRRASVPVLNVRDRARRPYRHVLVATDFSAPSARALQLAASWFPRAHLTGFYSYLPMAALRTGSPLDGNSFRESAQAQMASFLADSGVRPEVDRPLDTLIECGEVADLLRDYLQESDVDLVVMGSHGRGGLARALLGSTTEVLLHALDVDTLVVRPR
jgi:nucleotide-binding universal stress UspA family protein